MNPLVSIIIPTYNRASIMAATLDSVMAQSYSNWECIVVDDGSDDYTQELMDLYIEKDSRFKFYRRSKLPKGASHCRNIGLESAEGDFIIFLDSDDILLSKCLHKRVEIIRENEDQDFYVFPMYLEMNGNNVSVKEIPKLTNDEYLNSYLNYEILWGVMCVVWSKKILKKIKGFRVDYPRLNDPEIQIRALLESGSNYNVYNKMDPDCVYRMKEPSLKFRFERAQKFLDSLLLFIPDIKNELKTYNRLELVPLLRSYLKNFIALYFDSVSRKEILKLIKAFFKNGVITRWEYNILVVKVNSILVFNKLLQRNRKEVAKILK